MLNTVTDYNTRIAMGKSQELYIIEFLRSKGYKIDEPTANQDIKDKIDGFILPKAGGRISFQLKFRETGDDIPFELIKDWDRNIEGRDLISKAQLYIVVNRQGKVIILKTDDIKNKAKELLAMADANPNDQQGTGYELKFRADAAHGQVKLMCFLNPALFKIVASHQIPNYNN